MSEFCISLKLVVPCHKIRPHKIRLLIIRYSKNGTFRNYSILLDTEQPFRRHISFTSGSVLKQFANVFVVWVLTDYGHARHSFRLIRFDLPLPLHVLTFAKKDICCPCSNKNDGWKWKLIISLILVTMAMQKWYILATTWLSTIHRTPKFQHTHAITFPNSKTARKCYVDG